MPLLGRCVQMGGKFVGGLVKRLRNFPTTFFKLQFKMVRRAAISKATQDSLKAAIASGTPVQRTRTQAYTIKPANRAALTLLNADGTATANGRFYYKTLELPLPTAYAYEQELIDDRYVKGWDGTKILVRRRDTEGNWIPTSDGKQYFKMLRDEYQVTVPTGRPVRSGDAFILESLAPMVLSERFFSVPYLRSAKARSKMRSFLTEAEKEEWLKKQAREYLASLPKLNIGGTMYSVIFHDSTPVMWTGGDMTFSRQRTRVHANNDATVSTVLNRPLLDFCLPEGTWRPYELHENSFKKFEAGCVVQMIYDSFLIKKKPSGASRRAGVTGFTTTRGATVRDIEDDFDTIFEELGYKNGEYPFEHSWRRCGATPQMVLAYAKKHDLVCHVHFKDKLVASFCPPERGASTPCLNFSVFGSHAYYYGAPASGQKAFANHASAMMNVQKEDLAADCFSDKQLNRISIKAPASAYKQWGRFSDLSSALFCDRASLQYRGEGDAKTIAKNKKAFNLAPLFFCNHAQHSNLWIPFKEFVADIMRAAQMNKGTPEAFSVRLSYGTNPDEPCGCTLIVRDTPKIICKSVPREAQMLQRICDLATVELGLDPGALVYRGGSMAGTCEQLRLLFSKAIRCKRTESERATIALNQGNKCAACDTDLVTFEIDHRRALSEGGSDSVENCHALCLPCHAIKSEEERLCSLVTKPLFSDFSTDVLEGLIAAPKPQQLVWGDGHDNCFAVDAVRCRTNALVQNTEPLPVANVIDRIQVWCDDPDFLFIDAGPGSLATAPYFGPGWVWKETYQYLLHTRVCRRQDVVCVFRASEHAPPDALCEVYSRIEKLVARALEGQRVSVTDAYDERLHDANTIRGFAKQILLAMQGSWLGRSVKTWSVVNSTCSGDADGPIERTRQNDDGTTAFFSSKHIVSNRSMFLIGLITLHKEHLLMAKVAAMIAVPPRGG